MSSSAKNYNPSPEFTIIPARGGSKRVKDKNAIPINGRSLIERAIDAALFANQKTIFSSDSNGYLDFVKQKYGSNVTTLQRPKEFATDNIKVVDEIDRILLNSSLSASSYFAVLLPTAAFRTGQLFTEVIECFKTSGKGQFLAAPYDFPINFAFELGDEGNWKPLLGNDSPMISGNTRSQNQTKFYRPTGGIYIQNVGQFSKRKNLYDGCRPYLVEGAASLDIDTAFDLTVAHAIAKELGL